MASRCYICHLWEQTNFHIFFLCSMTNLFWSWLLNVCNSPPPAPFSVAAIWKVIFEVGEVSGRKWATALFFNGFSTLWFLRNDAKHINWKASLQRAQVIFEDRIKGLVISLSPGVIYPYPILSALGLVWPPVLFLPLSSPRSFVSPLKRS